MKNIICKYSAILLCIICCLSACSSDSPDKGESDLDVGKLSASGVSDAQGRGSVSFRIAEGVTHFQLITHTTGATLGLAALVGPSGEVLIAGDTTRVSGATQFTSGPNVLNFPVPGVTAPIQAGEYTAFYVTENPGGDDVGSARLRAEVVTKSDADPSNGTLKVDVVFHGAIKDSVETIDGINSAIGIFRQIYERAGLLLDVERYEIQGSTPIPNPRSGDVFYERLSAQTRPNSLLIVFANQVSNLQAPDGQSAVSGSLPGAFVPSNHSAIAVDLQAAAGFDGRFDFSSDEFGGFSDREDRNEIRLLAESLVFSTGQYLGLFETVTLEGDIVSSTDLLDTEKCINRTACQNNKGANGNIMFPEPLERRFGDIEDEFFPRDRISAGQRAVLHSSPGVD